MNIQVTGRTDDITPAMKVKAQEKVTKLLRFYDRITWVDVVLGGEKDRREAEVTAGLNRGATIVGKAKGADVYAAIDLAVDKIARQLRKHKEKLKNHRPRRSAITEQEPEPPVAGEDRWED